MVSPELHEHIVSCLEQSKRKALQEKIIQLGRMKITAVEEAQRHIIELIRELDRRGEIIVPRPDETVSD